MKAFGLDRLSRRGRIILGIVVALIVIALVAVFYEKGRTGNTYNPDARFVHQPPPKPPPKPATFNWPLFGYTPEHTRFFPAPASLAPPFHLDWRHHGSGLLEFPAVIHGDLLFQLQDSGVLYAINTETGRTVWHRSLGRLAASTPALDSKNMYVTLLEGPGGGGQGRAVALEQKTGRILWSRTLGSRSESSPNLSRSDVYFGSESGTVYALSKSSGRTVWTYQAAGAVKASPTLAAGKLYFGDYGGQVQAVSARTGATIWKTQSEGAALGSGTFYSTAAVIFGRVYLGNTDGHVYAYDEKTGSLDWAVQTGSYVYASPAVTETPRLGPTVYVGSYTGQFYALNAQSGAVRWTYPARGKISGSATIIGHVVYFAALGTHELLGLNIRTGRRVFRSPDGAFDPGISDGRRLYLSGGYTLYAYKPR